MKRCAVCLVLSLVLTAAGATLAWGAAPTVQNVCIDRGHDTDAPNWTSYHQRVTVCVDDADGAGNIASVTITDPDGGVHTITPTEGGAWWEEDGDTIGCQWSEWGLLQAPAGGSYGVTATDLDLNEDVLTTPSAPEVSSVHPELVAPAMESVIYDTTPLFQWTAGIEGSSNNLHLEEEGTLGELWAVGLGSGTEYLCPSPLQAGHSYFWMVDSWSPDDDRVSDSRVTIWTAQHTHGRFTVYEPWPELPELPGKFAYSVTFWGDNSLPHSEGGPIFGLSSIMGYNTDPGQRVWLAPNGSDYPDWASNPEWSPDGSKLLFSKGPGIWVDYQDGNPPAQIPGISGGDCRWAPDGHRVVYVVWGEPTEHTWPAGNADIWVANDDGTNAYPLVATEFIDRWPVWSPDGLWIAYRKMLYGEGCCDSLWMARYDGTADYPLDATEVVGYPGYEVGYMGEHAWSPDGKKLVTVFSAWSPGGAGIWGIGTIVPEDVDPDLTPVFVAPYEWMCCAAPHLPQWSPDGTQMAFTSGHHLPVAELPGYGLFSTGPELWLMNADGSGDPVRLTYDYSFDSYVSWWAPNTEPGANQQVTKGDTTVTFETVTEGGSTSITVFDEPPEWMETPQGFQFQGDYYEISTSAGISGTITIEIHYDDTGLTEEQEEWLCLLHWEDGEDGQWVDITVRPIDTVNNIIRGECTSLSAVGIAHGPKFVGLLPPINNDGSSVFKLGRTVPVKFRWLAPDGSFVDNAAAELYLGKVSNEVSGTVYEEADSPGNANTGNTFRYDAGANLYIFNLGTKGLSGGTWNLQVVVNGMVAKQVEISLE